MSIGKWRHSEWWCLWPPIATNNKGTRSKKKVIYRKRTFKTIKVKETIRRPLHLFNWLPQNTLTNFNDRVSHTNGFNYSNILVDSNKNVNRLVTECQVCYSHLCKMQLRSYSESTRDSRCNFNFIVYRIISSGQFVGEFRYLFSLIHWNYISEE